MKCTACGVSSREFTSDGEFHKHLFKCSPKFNNAISSNGKAGNWTISFTHRIMPYYSLSLWDINTECILLCGIVHPSHKSKKFLNTNCQWEYNGPLLSSVERSGTTTGSLPSHIAFYLPSLHHFLRVHINRSSLTNRDAFILKNLLAVWVHGIAFCSINVWKGTSKRTWR